MGQTNDLVGVPQADVVRVAGHELVTSADDQTVEDGGIAGRFFPGIGARDVGFAVLGVLQIAQGFGTSIAVEVIGKGVLSQIGTQTIVLHRNGIDDFFEVTFGPIVHHGVDVGFFSAGAIAGMPLIQVVLHHGGLLLAKTFVQHIKAQDIRSARRIALDDAGPQKRVAFERVEVGAAVTVQTVRPKQQERQA